MDKGLTMRIAIVTPYADPERGASVIRVNAFRNYFEEHGCKTIVLAPKRDNLASTKEVYRYGGIFELVKKICKSKADVVIGTSPPLTHNFFALLACKLSGKKFVLDAKEDPFVFEPHPSIFSKSGLKRRAYFLLRRFTYKNADLLFFLTDWDKKLEVKRYNLDPKKCLLVPNGSEPEVVYYSKDARKETREELNIPESAKVLVYAGGIGDEEIEKLIELFDKLNMADVFLLLVVSLEKANEWYLEEILKKANSLKRIKVVQNIPYEKMYRYLSAADIGLVPWPEKYFTSLPVKVFDYLSVGLPIVIKGPKKGALQDFYKKNRFIGFYSSEWAEFKKILVHVLKNTSEIKRMNEKRQKLAKEAYNRRLFLEKAFKRLKTL